MTNTCNELESINSTSSTITEILQQAAQDVLPPKKKKCSRSEIWKDDLELNKILYQRQGLPKESQQYKALSKALKKRINILRNLELQKEADNINENACQREVSELYRYIKSDITTFKNIQKTNQCDLTNLKNHFKKHFNDHSTSDCPIELTEAPKFINDLQYTNCVDINTDAPDTEELYSTIQLMKNRKAANDVPLEYIKSAMKCKEFRSELVKLYNTIWETKMLPSKWGHTKLVTIWKGASKGSSTDPKAYRGLQIGSSLCKVISIVIINRLKVWYENQLLDQQQGFRTGRGTTDCVFIAKRVHQISDKLMKPIYVLFIDLTAAFDHIERSWMFKSIYQRLKPDADRKLIELLESLYAQTTTSLAQTPEDAFELILGVRQGGPESPMLYNFYMDYVMRIYDEECQTKGIKFFNLGYRIPSSATTQNRMSIGSFTMDWIGYADDLALIFEDINNMQQGLHALSEIFSRYHLEINTSKTKSMILNHQYLNQDYPKSILKINGTKIDNVEKFNYLGCRIKYNEPSTGNTELSLRIDLAINKFYELGKKLMNYKIMLSTRAKIFNALVRSRLLYGCQTWNLTKAQTNHINAVYMSMIRKMVKGGYRRKEGSFSYVLTNQDLLLKCKTESIDKYIKRQQRNYVAHVIRKPNSSLVKRLLFNSDQGKKRGRQQTLYKMVIENERTTPDLLHFNALSRHY